ncbi:MAG TPA: hypothetical protein VFC00_28010 [Micromonosporaceae bacterium]|nr:hypothetical protein [Micromonosporaceae bacterium]
MSARSERSEPRSRERKAGTVKSRWLATLGVSSLVALALATGACNVTAGGTGATPTPSASPTAMSEADAKAALQKAAVELSKTSYKIQLAAGPVSGNGAMDPVGKNGQLTLNLFMGSATAKLDTVLIGADMWLKTDGIPVVPDKWLHLDTARLPDDSPLGVRPGRLDPVNSEKLFDAATKIENVGRGQFKGTVDLTKLSSSAIVDRATVETLGDRAKAVPFEATIDDQGRLTNFKMDLGTVDNVPMKVNVTYSDFGTSVSPTKPAASDVMEAPEAVYNLLGG